MTLLQLQEILKLTDLSEVVKKLSVSSYTLTAWSTLEEQYEPSKHKIQDTTLYPPRLNENGIDDFKRTSLALQKLAVRRVAQSMFSTPVKRDYQYDKENEKLRIAEAILEDIYKTKNAINSENLERAKKLNASCQIATVWRVAEAGKKSWSVQGEQSKFKLFHSTYSPMDGYTLYPINDENGELLVLSISYKDTDNVEYLDCYLNLETPEFRRYTKIKDWELLAENNKKLEFFPVVYAHIQEPVWGGEDGTALVEQLEEMESFDGLYIKRNAIPAFVLDYGDTSGMKKITGTEEESNASRRIIKVGKGGNMYDVTWEGAGESVNNRYQRLRNSFFEQNQIPDTSFSNMIKSNTSAENKELVFADAKAYAKDLGGEWERFFYEEINIVKEFAKVMFPSYAAEFDELSVSSTIIPYSIFTKKENAEYVSLAGNSMSTETKVRVLGEVSDVDQEVEAITGEISASNNLMG